MSVTQVPSFSTNQEFARAKTIPIDIPGLVYPFVDKGIDELKEGQNRLRIFSEFGKKIIAGFGSARLGEDSPWYQAAMETAQMLAELGAIAVTGGGPAIMEAWNRGGHKGNGLSFSCSIVLEHEQESNPYVDLEAKFDYFFTRKILLMKGCHALVCFPGGYGTLDELFEALNLIHKGRMAPIPIVLFGKDFWQPHIDFLKNVAVPMGLLTNDDLKLVKVVDTPLECVSHLRTKLDFGEELILSKGKPNLAISEKMFERTRQEFNDAIYYLSAQPPPVSFSGSSSLNSGRYVNAAMQLGRILGNHGLTTLTSESNPLTQFLNAGVLDGGGDTLGFVNPAYRTNQEPIDLNLNHRIPVYYQFIREVLSHKLSIASVMFPGGFGTLDRAFELLTLKQTKKITNNNPLIGYGSAYWKKIMDMTHDVHFNRYKTIGNWEKIDGKDVYVDNDSTILKVSDDLDEIGEIVSKAA